MADKKESFSDRLTDEDIREFQDIWKRTFKEKISDGDARFTARRLLHLYAMLARPLPSELTEKEKKDSSKTDLPVVQTRPSSLREIRDIVPPKQLPPTSP